MNNMPHFKKKKTEIIVVEDDRDINELISYNLRKEKFNVTQVFDGFDAQQVLAKNSFNIVILDLMLPGVDGFKLCKQIKEKISSTITYIIIVSAKTDFDDKLCASILGADRYITKPFSIVRLLSIIKELDGYMRKEYTVT